MSAQGVPRLYHFRTVIEGFFEFPTESARTILPHFLEPVEVIHGSSVLSAIAFDFHESPVGAFGEIVLAILVAPRIEKVEPWPRAAFFPVCVGTSTEVARAHGIEQWHLPHHPRDVTVTWHPGPKSIRAHVADACGPMLDLTVAKDRSETVEHPYQCFMSDASGDYVAKVVMAGHFSETEDGEGALTIHSEDLRKSLRGYGPSATPFREIWMRDGFEAFHPLKALASRSRP